ncbi:MAG: hypothetical protein ACFFDN_35465 [Candidatus Hodarchaeota archaeon]
MQEYQKSSKTGTSPWIRCHAFLWGLIGWNAIIIIFILLMTGMLFTIGVETGIFTKFLIFTIFWLLYSLFNVISLVSFNLGLGLVKLDYNSWSNSLVLSSLFSFLSFSLVHIIPNRFIPLKFGFFIYFLIFFGTLGSSLVIKKEFEVGKYTKLRVLEKKPLNFQKLTAVIIVVLIWSWRIVFVDNVGQFR